MQYIKSTHHIKSENIHVKNISHNAVLISYTYTHTYAHIYTHAHTSTSTSTSTSTYAYIHMYMHIYVHKYAYIYIHQNVYTYIHIHTYTYIYMHKMKYYLRILCLSIFRFKKEWYKHLPNHVNIWESAHVIWKMNFSLFVKLANDGPLFSSLLVNNARSASLSLQAVTKCSSFSTTLQDRHNRSSTFNWGWT